MKKYTVKHSGISTVISYSLGNMFAEWAVVTNIYGIVNQYANDDKMSVLLIMFNVLSVFSCLIFGAVADNVNNKKTGVLLGVGLMAMGFVYPSTFGITAKVVLSALGMGAINGFALCDITENFSDKNLSVGAFIGFGVLGYGLGKFNMYYGYLACALAVICAVIPTNRGEEKKQEPKKIIDIKGIIFALVGFAAAFVFFISLNSQTAFDWILLRKHIVVAAFAFCVGAAASDFICKKFGIIITAVVGTLGYAVLTLWGNGKLTSLCAIVCLGIIVSALLRIISKNAINKGFTSSLVFVSYYSGIILQNVTDISLPKDSSVFTLVSCAVVLCSAVLLGIFTERAENK